MGGMGKMGVWPTAGGGGRMRGREQGKTSVYMLTLVEYKGAYTYAFMREKLVIYIGSNRNTPVKKSN